MGSAARFIMCVAVAAFLVGCGGGKAGGDGYKLKVSVSPSHGGTVSVNPKMDTYNIWTDVEVTAAAADGYMFAGWSGESAEISPSVTIKMSGSKKKKLTANFVISKPPSDVSSNPDSIVMVRVSGGAFGDFSISKYEVTQGLWKSVMGNNPSAFTGDDDLPVDNVSWNDVQEFIGKLNGITGKEYRLPADKEWEYAARGGGMSKRFEYSGSHYIDDVAWYDDNSDGKTHIVGTRQANELGIHDMNGNVGEWTSTVIYGSSHTICGCSWYDTALDCRLSDRDFGSPAFRRYYVGFRLAMSQ